MSKEIKIAMVLIVLALIVLGLSVSWGSSTNPAPLTAEQKAKLEWMAETTNKASQSWGVRVEEDHLVIFPKNGNPLPSYSVYPFANALGKMSVKEINPESSSQNFKAIMEGDGAALTNEVLK